MAKDAKEKSEKEQSNRPENTKFKQQKLDAWQPILTPAWVIGTFIVIGVVFVPVGAYLWKLSDDLFEAVVTYDSYDVSQINGGSEACRITTQNEGFREIQNGTQSYGDCTLSITFDRDVDEDDTVYVYYQIENFYQNHRRYVKSVSDSQLDGEVTINPVTSLTDSVLSSACDPPQSFAAPDVSPTFGRIYYPCGLIALSYFNDEIALASFTSASGETQSYLQNQPVNRSQQAMVFLDRKGIAWESDLDNKYSNPVAEDCSLDISNVGGNRCLARYFQYQFLWQTYDQFLCYPTTSDGVPDISQPPSECMNYTTYINQQGNDTYGEAWFSFVEQNFKGENIFFGEGCVQCVNSSDALMSLGGIPPPLNNTADSDGGLRDESFIVWMRTAGLPVFRKLYGNLKPPAGGFKKGDTIQFTVVSNFLVESISGSKSLVLGTTSPLGGKNDILGIAYMTVGAICLFLAGVFGLKMKLHPRKLGDPQYLQWKKN